MTLQALFDGFQALPPIPKVVQEVLARSRDDTTQDGSLAQLIATDQAISARLLQVANSARYQMPQQIRAIGQAMQLLGQVNVRTLVVSLGLISGFQQLPPALLRPLWRYHLHTAAQARQGAPAAGVDAELAYTLGLLQGMGQMVLLRQRPQGMLPMEATVGPLAPSRLAQLRQTLGYSDTDVSAELARRWQFPALFVQVLQAMGAPPGADLPPDVARLAALTRVSAWQAWAATQLPLTPDMLTTWPLEAARDLGLPDIAASGPIASLEILCPALHELLG